MVTPRDTLSMRPWQGKRWLVLAPHADDETLGAGASIAQMAGEGRLSGVVFLTDGSGSHTAGGLVAVRRREAALALRRLTGGGVRAPLHLGWKDASPAQADDAAFARTSRSLAHYCRRHQVDALAVTALHEPHCDHAAAAHLAYAVQKAARRPLEIWEYVVWATPLGCASHKAVRTALMPRGLRRHALSSHRSQLTAAYGPGFRLPKEKAAMAAFDTLYRRRT